MAWARYDDELPMNRKVGALLAYGANGAAAIGLHLLANTWSRHNGTAGMVPTAQPGLLVGDAKLGRRLAAMLTDVGMFDPTGDGWMIHDFDEFSDPNDDGRSAAEKKRDVSEKRAASGRQGGLAKAGKRASKTGSKSVATPQQTSSPEPEPVPVVHVSDNSTPENTLKGGDNSSKRDAVIERYAHIELAAARAKGTKIRTEDGFLAHKRQQARDHADLDRWLQERPTAPASAVASWIAGDTHSMAYYPAEELAEVIQLREGA